MMIRAFWVSVVVGLLAGCGSIQGPAIRYYKLNIPPAPTPAGPSVSVPLRIEPFETTSLLRQDRIVYCPSSVEVGFYDYHRWAEPPKDTITKAIADQLTARRLFQSVEISEWSGKSGVRSERKYRPASGSGLQRRGQSPSYDFGGIGGPGTSGKSLGRRRVFRNCRQEKRCAGGCNSHGAGFAAEYRAIGDRCRDFYKAQSAWGGVLFRDSVSLNQKLLCSGSFAVALPMSVRQNLYQEAGRRYFLVVNTLAGLSRSACSQMPRCRGEGQNIQPVLLRPETQGIPDERKSASRKRFLSFYERLLFKFRASKGRSPQTSLTTDLREPSSSHQSWL